MSAIEPSTPSSRELILAAGPSRDYLRLVANLHPALDRTRIFVDNHLTPDPWQRQFSHDRAPRSLILCHRQAGKSSAAAISSVNEAVYRPPALVLMLSRSGRQASELLRKARGYARPLEDIAPIIADAATSIAWENGSRILSLPSTPDTAVGYSAAQLIVLDEAGMMPDALYHFLRPILAVSRGRLIALGTPRGARGWFWDLFTKGGTVDQDVAVGLTDGWKRYVTDVNECPRIDAEFLADEKRDMPKDLFDQEWLCRFIAPNLDGDSPIDPIAVNAAFVSPKKPLF